VAIDATQARVPSDSADASGIAEALAAILVTHELDRRPDRPADHAAENAAIHRVMAGMAVSREAGLLALAEAGADLTGAASAGVSLLVRDGGQATLRWEAVAGRLAGYGGQTLPRHDSPCGAVLDRNEALLLRSPQQVFPAIAALDPPVAEWLAQPLYRDGLPTGTLWAVSHDPRRRFCAEDARLLDSLARLASLAYQLRCVADDALTLNEALSGT